MASSNDEFAEDLLRLLSRAERLEAFPRTGWQVCGVQNPESVAAHSYMVALIACWLADRIDTPVDTERVLRIALVHDLSEAMLTDLPRPVKVLLGKEAVRKAEEKAAQQILATEPAPFLQAHDEYMEATSLEARLVKAADRIQMLAKALQYRAEKRGRTERFFDDPSTFDDYGIPLVRAIFDRLRYYHQEDCWFSPDFD